MTGRALPDAEHFTGPFKLVSSSRSREWSVEVTVARRWRGGVEKATTPRLDGALLFLLSSPISSSARLSHQ